jgi:hypothetical protein
MLVLFTSAPRFHDFTFGADKSIIIILPPY